MLLPIRQFFDQTGPQCGDKAANWCSEVVATVADKYLQNVNEVLEAVLKMEESLKRLKRARDIKKQPAAPAAAADPGGSNKMSDDDKIRLQLYVDVKHFVLGLGFIVEDAGLPHSVTQLESVVTQSAPRSCLELASQ